VSSIEYDPGAVRTDRTSPAALTVQTGGSVASIRLDFSAGGSMTLTSGGSGRWTASVPAAKLLSGYVAADVNHNFVGFLRLLGSGGETLATYNSFINVVDGRVSMPPLRQIDATARAATRVLNLLRPTLTSDDVRSAVLAFYAYYRDDFDFVQVVYALPSYPANRYHFQVRNDVQGIGVATLNESAQFGSAGKLKGITVFPIDTLFDLGESAFSHELGHQWINYLKNPALQAGSPHWPPSTMARGIMGFNIPGTSVGGNFPWQIDMVTPTTARVTASTVSQEFSDFDLYLMGFIPPSAVSPGIILQGTPCQNCIVNAAPITIADVIAANGPRVPDSSTSQKSFRIGTVVISRDRLLTDDELATLDYFAARGESISVLQYTSGFASGTTKPFYVATRHIGSVDFRLDPPPPKHRAARH